MLFGAVIAPGNSVTPKHDLANIVHVSQLCLNEPTSNEKTYVQLVDGNKSYCICALQKDVQEHATVDIFFSTTGGLKLTTKGGQNEVHVIGYFEPDEESFISDSDDEDEEDDEQDEDDEGGDEPASKRKAGNKGK
ncbi:bifunctional Nucleoplasmin core domain superfamily/Nucleoplasmin-like domain [Babesia duncani]|uniref:Bifunctional Nucleoplasmin core domain superfamily/Nucleoplasmin-like domain n=1 Tax=Babesia duncani TaxID=323732 RepID=A0AAD9UNW8_9APIC|nr:bifunctional Nucleoplasmin core domain superfamily/Nucleoplasmin-like domain [Babesia duncani]